MYSSKYLRIKSQIAKIFDKLYIPDNVCLSCNNYFKPTLQGYVCDDCIASIKPMLFEKENLSYIDSYRIFSSYDKALKEMIIALKFKKASLFANIIADIVKDDFFAFLRSINPDIVTYVPVSFLRFWQRGYDQNAILLKALNAEYISIFKRIKHAKPLSLSIDKNQREHIVSGAFKIKKEFVFNLEGKKVLVFDDILTTGATATQIAKTLKMHAVKEVYFYFIASHKRNIDMV